MDELTNVAPVGGAADTVAPVAPAIAPEAPQKDRDTSVRALLRENIDKARAGTLTPKARPAKTEAPTKITPVPPVETAAAAAQRARDEQGRFAKADGTAPETATTIAGERNTAQPASAATPDPASTPAVEAAPVSWAADAKQAWATLPPAIQAAVLKREKEVSDGFKQYGEKTKRYDDLERVIAPRRGLYADSGRSDAELINQLWTWNEALLRNPREAFPALAQVFGYDLAQAAPGTSHTPPEQQSQIDPTLRGVLDPINKQLSELGGNLSAVQAQIQREQQARDEAMLNGWAKDKPHFERVRTAMGKLMQAGMANDLDDAYQKATWADPETRAAMQRDELAKAEAKRAADQKAAQPAPSPAALSAKARSAAVSVRSATPLGNAAPPQKAKGKSVGESLREALRDAAGAP